MTADVRVCADADELSRRAAEAAVEVIQGAVRDSGRCAVVLSGGTTPRPLYQLLATEFGARIPWPQVDVFWGDERYVPPDDPASNYRMAREALLDHVPCPAQNIHPMPTQAVSPEAAAREYEHTLQALHGNGGGAARLFDLVLLGLGQEGHTASLFPGSPALAERRRWVAAVTAPIAPAVRLTLTLPALTRAAHIYVLATGSAKAPVLHEVLTGTPDPNTYPAAGLRLTEGTLTWWVDRNASHYPP
jgi:6-phosphogluconolactonase